MKILYMFIVYIVLHSYIEFEQFNVLIFLFLVCGGIFTDSKGIIESPFYPNPYPQNKICTYLIQQPVGKAIKLSFLDFDIDDVSYPQCTYDSLEVKSFVIPTKS